MTRTFPKSAISRLLLGLMITGLSGCSAGFFGNAPGFVPAARLSGKVIGGDQPVTGSKIYLYAASTSGYGRSSRYMLNTPGYVTTTGTDGSFSISYDYTCQTGDMVYLVAQGGNPGLTPAVNNSAITLMAALGPCSSLAPSDRVIVNEVTTVATAYAMAGFMTSPTALASSGSTLALQGVTNAFRTAKNLFNIGSGQMNPTTPAGNGTVPAAEVNTLANILASCVNTDGTASACMNLFAYTTPAGGSAPSNVGQAVLNIAHNPGLNVSNLFALSAAATPFQPTLSAAPNDWTLAVSFTSTDMNGPNGIALDGSGNVWYSNATSVGELDPAGVPQAPSAGYTSGAIGTYIGNSGSTLGLPAVSPTGQLWIQVYDGSTAVSHIAVLNQNGSAANGATGYAVSGISGDGVFDSSGNYWNSGTATTTTSSSSGVTTTTYAGNLVEMSSTGTLLSPAGGYKGGGQGFSFWLAADALGNLWAPSYQGRSRVSSTGATTYNVAVSKLANTGSAVSPSTGFTNSNYSTTSVIGQSGAVDRFNNFWTASGAKYLVAFGPSGTSTSYPVSTLVEDVSVDGDNHIWWYDTTRLNVMDSTGTVLSGTNGYVSPYLPGGSLARPDQSGNVWIASFGGSASIVEFVGLAAPTVVPFSYAVAHSGLGNRP